MFDILLDKDGDLKISDGGDITITNSVRQAISIRLRWFLGEWRFGPEAGLPYFQEIFVKNPNKPRICQFFREAILSVDEVTAVPVLTIDIDAATRKAVLRFTAVTEEDTFTEEVLIGA